jgi:hypothetical protein
VPDIDLNELAKSLYARRHEAVVVPYEAKTIVSGPPIERDCHRNTDRWVMERADHKAVRGWMVFDFNRTSEGLLPNCRFTAHSVVETPDGKLFDLTPAPHASKRYPFLRHQGSNGEFEAIVSAGHIVHLDFAVFANSVARIVTGR